MKDLATLSYNTENPAEKGLRIKNRQISTLLNKHLNSLERLFFWILFLTRDIFGNDNVNTKLPGIKKGLKGC